MLLVIRADECRVGRVYYVVDILRPRIAEDAAGFAVQGMRRDLRPIHLRVVFADDDQRVARLETQLVQAQAEVDDLLINFIPTVFLPDAVALFALRYGIAQFMDAPEEALRQGVLVCRHRFDGMVQLRGEYAPGRGRPIRDRLLS